MVGKKPVVNHVWLDGFGYGFMAFAVVFGLPHERSRNFSQTTIPLSAPPTLLPTCLPSHEPAARALLTWRGGALSPLPCAAARIFAILPYAITCLVYACLYFYATHMPYMYVYMYMHMYLICVLCCITSRCSYLLRGCCFHRSIFDGDLGIPDVVT